MKLPTNHGIIFSVNGDQGYSFERAIHLKFVDDGDYEKTERDIIHALYLLKNASYRILNNKLSRYDGKMYDIVKVGFTNHSAQRENVFKIETIHFDVSSFWGE